MAKCISGCCSAQSVMHDSDCIMLRTGMSLLQEYNFKVQVPGKGGDDKMITVGKADVDLSKFVVFEGKAQPKMIPIMFKVGATTTGYLKVVVTTELLQAGVDDDGMTEVSGMTGLTSTMDMVEQDLSGGCSERRKQQVVDVMGPRWYAL